jgi:glycosyltransferase involved in cell wall biosynthesis
MKIVYSSERRGEIRNQIGRAHYSYTFIEDAYVRALVRAGYDMVRVEAPEIFKAAQTYASLLDGSASDFVHLSFRTTENIRILPGAWNVGCFLWEFDVLRDRNLITDAVTTNQAHMLNLLDEVWTPCSYTADILVRHGVTRTRMVPLPIYAGDFPARMPFEDAASALAETPCIPLILSGGAARELNARMAIERLAALGAHKVIKARRAGEAGRIFLTVCNPQDLRKNLLGMIEGFQYAAGDSSDDLLILKLGVPNEGDFRATTLYDAVFARFCGPGAIADPRIVVIAEFLDDAEMSALYALSDFYLCASHCEGFNLPLVEAMSYGTAPISTRNTAMLDYIDENDAIVIDERRFPAPIAGMAADVVGVIYDLAMASRFDIARAIRNAMAMDATSLERLADAARSAIRSRYSAASVVPLIEQRLSAATAGRKALAHAG